MKSNPPKTLDDLPPEAFLEVDVREFPAPSVTLTLRPRTHQAYAELAGIRIIPYPSCAPGVWMVRNANAQHGWGPLIYDIAMEYAMPGGLISDRAGVSLAAANIWRHYASRRPDVGGISIVENVEYQGCTAMDPMGDDPRDYIYIMREPYRIDALKAQGRWRSRRNQRDLLLKRRLLR